jgi:hypothetical protein
MIGTGFDEKGNGAPVESVTASRGQRQREVRFENRRMSNNCRRTSQTSGGHPRPLSRFRCSRAPQLTDRGFKTLSGIVRTRKSQVSVNISAVAQTPRSKRAPVRAYRRGRLRLVRVAPAEFSAEVMMMKSERKTLHRAIEHVTP